MSKNRHTTYPTRRAAVQTLALTAIAGLKLRAAPPSGILALQTAGPGQSLVRLAMSSNSIVGAWREEAKRPLAAH